MNTDKDDASDLTIDHGEKLENYDIVRPIRTSANWIAYLVHDKKGNPLTLTYCHGERFFQDHQILAFQEGVAQQELEAEARRQLAKYEKRKKDAASRVKGIELGHVQTVHGWCYDKIKKNIVVVSEYMPGVNIFYASRLLNWKQILFLFVQVIEGLLEIHDSGFLHLNVKPQNITVNFGAGGPQVKLTDFGFAIPIQGYDGEYGGTPLYMAPEVVLEHRGKIDRRADLFTAGIVFYECVTSHNPLGHRIIARGDRGRLKHIVEREKSTSTPPSHYKREIPPELDKLSLDLLQKEPEKRNYNDAGDVLNYIYEKWPEESRQMTRQGTSTLSSYDESYEQSDEE